MDKIRDHPQYDSVSAKDKAMNRDALRVVIPKAEKLKKQLLDKYQEEFDKYLEDLKERERIEKERLRQEELQRYFVYIVNGTNFYQKISYIIPYIFVQAEGRGKQKEQNGCSGCCQSG